MNPVFHVLTEFRFDAASAIAESQALQGAVGGISNAADDALNSISRLALGISAQFGLGTGIAGVLYQAVQASEKFDSIQRKIANIFVSNPNAIAGGAVTFEQAMAAANDTMSQILDKSRKFALPANDLADISVLVGAALFPKGLTGNNLDQASEIGRGALKTAAVLGVPSQNVVQPIVDLASGRGQMNDQFTQRLVADTAAFQNLVGKGGGSGKSPLAGFNALPAAQRIKTLTDALLQFGSNAQIVAGNAQSLTQQFTVLKDTLTGAYSILRSIGKVFADFGSKILMSINEYLGKHGGKIAENIASIIRDAFKDPSKLFVDLLQLKRLKEDLNLAGRLAGLYAIFQAVRWGLGFLGIQLGGFFGLLRTGLVAVTPYIRMFFAALGNGLMLITGASSVLGAFWTILQTAFFGLMEFLKPLAALLLVFQLISRAMAIAKVEDAKAMLQTLPDLTEALARLKHSFSILIDPFVRLFDAIAQGLSPLFRFSYYLDALVWLLNRVTDVIILFQAGFQGMMFVIFESFSQLKSFFTGGGFSFAKIGEAFTAGVDDAIARNLDTLKTPDGAVSNQVTNIGHVTINNAFKEQLEPDRIAFTLKDQLLKAAANPNQARNRSLNGAFAAAGT